MAGARTQPQTVKLFRHKGGQAVPIPEEFELSGKEAVVRKEGDRLVIEPAEQNGNNIRADEDRDPLVAYFRSLPRLETELEPIPDLPVEPVELP